MDWFWSHRLPLVLGARDSGYEVTVVAPGAASEGLSGYGLEGIDLPASGLIATVLRLRSILNDAKPDILHAITLKYAFMTGLATLGKNIRVVHTIAGLGYLFFGEGLKPKVLRTVLGPLLKAAVNTPRATLIFQNPDDREVMVRLRGFATPLRSVLIRGSGVDIAVFKATPEPDNSVPMVLMPSRLVREKGVEIFAQAARLLKSQGVSACFVIAGGIDHHNPNALREADLKALITDGAVEWVGKIADMPSLYAASTLIAYPSWYGEGIPKVLLEAASSGRAIVTTDHPGCREAVTHNDNGLLVPIKDALALARAIQLLLENPDMRRRMAARGRERAQQEFDVRRIVCETLAVYQL